MSNDAKPWRKNKRRRMEVIERAFRILCNANNRYYNAWLKETLK